MGMSLTMQRINLGKGMFSFEYTEFKMFIQVEWEVKCMRLDFEREMEDSGVEVRIWIFLAY